MQKPWYHLHKLQKKKTLLLQHSSTKTKSNNKGSTSKNCKPLLLHHIVQLKPRITTQLPTLWIQVVLCMTISPSEHKYTVNEKNLF